jgi:tetratricopeptide (TPR) repeat protein
MVHVGLKPSRNGNGWPTKQPKIEYRHVDSFGYVASALVDSGVEHHARGEPEHALKAFHVALKAQRLSLGKDHICIAHTLGNIGAVYLRQGKLLLANEALEDALGMKVRLIAKQKRSGQKSEMLLAETMNNLGNVAYLRGDYTTSLKYYRTTLKDLRVHKGPQKDLANALHNIGRINIHHKEWDAALSVLTECNRIERVVYGPDHILLADTHQLIGFVHLTSSNLDAAMRSFSEALSILRTVYGPVHADVATCLFNIGMVREARGNLKDAWEVYTKARDIYNRLRLEDTHRGLKAARRSIANVEQRISSTKDSAAFKFLPIEQREE